MKNVGHLAIVPKEPINTDGIMGVVNDESGESIAMLAVSVNRHGGTHLELPEYLGVGHSGDGWHSASNCEQNDGVG